MDLLIQLNVENKEEIMELANIELMRVEGGINFSGALVSSLTRALNTFFTIGQAIGSSVRRVTSRNLCQL